MFSCVILPLAPLYSLPIESNTFDNHQSHIDQFTKLFCQWYISKVAADISQMSNKGESSTL